MTLKHLSEDTSWADRSVSIFEHRDGTAHWKRWWPRVGHPTTCLEGVSVVCVHEFVGRELVEALSPSEAVIDCVASAQSHCYAVDR